MDFVLDDLGGVMGRRVVGGKWIMYINCDIDETMHDERVFLLDELFSLCVDPSSD